MANLFLMSGPCGAGKTTLSHQLAQEYNLRYLGIEDFYAVFFGSELIHDHEEEVWEAFSIAIRAAMDDGVDVIIDTNAPTRADRQWFIDRFPAFTFHLISVSAPREICRANNTARSRTIPSDELEALYDAVEPVADDEPFKTISFYENIDNSGLKLVRKLEH
jgi:predicted kinase